MSKSHDKIKVTNSLFNGDVIWPAMTLEPGFRDARKYDDDDYEPVVNHGNAVAYLHQNVINNMGLDKATVEILTNDKR